MISIQGLIVNSINCSTLNDEMSFNHLLKLVSRRLTSSERRLRKDIISIDLKMDSVSMQTIKRNTYHFLRQLLTLVVQMVGQVVEYA